MAEVNSVKVFVRAAFFWFLVWPIVVRVFSLSAGGVCVQGLLATILFQ